MLVFSQSVDELRAELTENSQKIDQLNTAIKQDQQELQKLSGQKQTLNNAIVGLRYSENKLTREIFQTESEIRDTEEKIESLSGQATDLQASIENNKQIIGGTLQAIAREADIDFVEALFLYQTFSEYLDRAITLEQTGDLLQEQYTKLVGKKKRIDSLRDQQDEARGELVVQNEQLGDRKQIVANTKQQKAVLLSQTKNQEQSYQRSLSEKQAEIKEYEQAITNLENSIRIILDKNSFARPKQGLLRYPFEGWYRITQFFGNTEFSNTGFYNGRGHNGVDFATPLGTPVYATAAGTILGSGNTDKFGGRDANGVYRKCISHGGWVVINHAGGISTRYNHLSLIKAVAGQTVSRGQLIGYSGNTGNSTGPHLHVTVAVTKGIQIKRLGDVIQTNYCRNAIAPITASNAYLDPFDYLPRVEIPLKAVKEGENNLWVKRLQNMLKYDGVFPLEVFSSGQYGPTTTTAVAAWKKKYGLKGDGKEFSQDAISVHKTLK